MRSFTKLSEQPAELKFDSNESRIIRTRGIPPGAFAEMRADSHVTLCGIRAEAATDQRARRRSAFPKPGTVQAKSFNIERTTARDSVCVDPRYTGWEKNNNEWKPKERKEGDIPKNQPFTHLNVSLYEVVKGIESKDFELVSLKNNELCFRHAGDLPNAIKGDVFKIKLNEGVEPQKIKSLEAIEIDVKAWRMPIARPEWWDQFEESGDAPSFELVAGQDFKKLYKPAQEEEFKPFLIYGTRYGNSILPIVSDMDQFLLGFDSNFMQEIQKRFPDANKEFMAMAGADYADENAAFKKARFELEKVLWEMKLGRELDVIKPDDADILEEISKRISEGNYVRGKITPLESLYSDLENDKMLQSMPHLLKLFQHASEARNPYPPSKLGGVVFFMNGGAYECDGAQAIAQFLLEKALPKFVFPIHPKWPMEHFGPVVAKQLSLGGPHLVQEKTRAAFNSWLNEELKKPDNEAAKKIVESLPPRGKIISQRGGRSSILVQAADQKVSQEENAEVSSAPRFNK